MHDQLCRLQFKMAGVMKLVVSVPKSFVMRCCVEMDAPKPGHAMCIWSAWNIEKDAPELGMHGFVRMAMVEPLGPNQCRFTNVSKMAGAMPAWVAGIFMSNTILPGAQAVRADAALRLTNAQPRGRDGLLGHRAQTCSICGLWSTCVHLRADLHIACRVPMRVPRSHSSLPFVACAGHPAVQESEGSLSDRAGHQTTDM